MNRRYLSLIVMVLGQLLISVSISHASAAPRYRLRNALTVALPHAERVTAATARSVAAPRAAGAAATSPGTTFGATYWDCQQDGSMGRQVDRGPSSYIQASWTTAPGPSSNLSNVLWNRTSVTGSPAPFVLDNGAVISRLPLALPLLPGGQSLPGSNPRYTNFRNRPSGKGTVIHHDSDEFSGEQYIACALDLSAANGIFGSPSILPVPPGPQYNMDGVIWPKQAVSTCGSDLIHHAVGVWAGREREVWYWRGVINDPSGLVTWGPAYPVLIDPAEAFVTAVVEAFGSEVSIVMLKRYNPENSDVIYHRSTDCGLTWQSPVNITNYAPDGSEGGYTELNAVYDPAGNLHVIWNTAPSNGLDYPTHLYHWSPQVGARLITSAGWANSCAGGGLTPARNNGAGTNNLAIAEPALSVKPAGLGPGSGIANELIYALWSQYGPTDSDCSTLDAAGTPGGGVNSDLYVSISSNGGVTWDRPQNITGTMTPNCLPGDCYGEGWISAAALADSGLYISYIEDRHSGPALLGDGEWTENAFKVLALATRYPVLEPVIAVTPTEYHELDARPSGGEETVELKVMNAGNADLTFTVNVTNDDGGAAHVLVNGGPTYGNTILAGGPPDVITVSYDAIGLPDPSEHNWRLEVTSNDPTNDPGQGGNPIDVELQVFAAEIWHTCTQDTLSTGMHRMRITSCLEMGGQGTPGTGFVAYADSSEWLVSGSPVITLNRSGEKLAFHNAFMNLLDRTRLENKSFRAQSELYVRRDSSVTSGDSTFTADVAKGVASSTDSTIGINYEVLFFKNAAMQNGGIYKLSMFNQTGSTISDMSYGVVADVDVGQGGALNIGRGSESEGWIGAEGGDYFDDVFVPDQTFMSIFYLPPPGGCDRMGAIAAQVLSNANYVHPNGAFEVDSLYRLFDTFGALGTWGSYIHIDTGQMSDDVSLMMVNGHNQSLGPLDTIRWGYGLAVSNVSVSDLEATIDALRYAANPSCIDLCPELPGDVNCSGTVTSADLIGLINYVFMGGVPPCHPLAGDVDYCEGIDIRDILYLVNFLFAGGPAPICPPTRPFCGWPVSAEDTLAVTGRTLPAGADSALLTFRVANVTTILGATLPLRITVEGSPVTIDSIAWSPRTSDLERRNYNIDGGAGTVLIGLTNTGGLALEPGNGDILSIAVSTPVQPYPRTVRVDTLRLPPSNSLLFIKPFLEGIVPVLAGFGGTEQLDCANSFASPCLVACPAGDAAFSVYLRDQLGAPFGGSNDVWLDFSGCPSVVPCASETEWPIVRPAGSSDASGKVTFLVHAGGCAEGCTVEVRSSCGLIATVPFKSVDIDGDLFVKPQDYVGSLCNDYNCSGGLEGTDLTFITKHLGHSCTSDPCDLMAHTITLEPDTGLQVGQIVDAHLEVQNGTAGVCRFDSVVFYESGFDVGGTPERVTERSVGLNLASGGTAEVTIPYTIPGSGFGCVLARIYTSCCDSSSLAEHCVNVIRLDCPAPDSFEFSYWIYPTGSVYYKPMTSSMPMGFRSGMTLGEGWLSTASIARAWIAIDQFATFGADASIIMLLCSDNTCSTILTRREFRVFYQQQRGDVNRDCAITSADIIHLVNYVFKSGPAPLPDEEAGNANCAGGITSADIIFLVNYVFKGGDPPLGQCPP